MTETMDTDAPAMTVKMDVDEEVDSKPSKSESETVENGINGHAGHNGVGTHGIENGSSEQPSTTTESDDLAAPTSASTQEADTPIVAATTTPPPPSSQPSESDPVVSTTAPAGGAVDGEVSPSSLRRSTRASALKAQEKIKAKDGMDVYAPNGLTHHHHNHHDASGIEALHDSIHQNGDSKDSAATNKDEPASKKPKLNHGLDLDQYDWKFGVRMDKDDVYMLTDESEISSLNSAEVGGLRKNYEEFKNAGITPEQQFERDIQVRQLESSLRFEENKLITLKKVVQNQKEAEVESAKRAKQISEIAERQRQATQAYKPTVAANPAKVNGAKHSKAKAANNARDNNLLSNIDPQQAMIIQKLLQNPQYAAQVPKQLQQLFAAHANGLAKSSSVGANLSMAAVAAQASQQQQQQVQAKKEPPVPTITPAQRAAEARRKLRQQLDQQLLSQPTPKGLPTEMNFVPSATNDFCYLLGLDLTVQRVLKDKNVFKKYEEQPYVCEECHTDFTPSWKAIGTSENDLHLYCEACVKSAQKRQMKANHERAYKKLFGKVKEQMDELEKQIADGKFNDPPPPPTPVVAPPSKPSTPVNAKAANSSMPSSASAGNMSNMNMMAILAAQKAKAAQAAAAAAAAQAQQPSTSAQASRSQTQGRGTKRPANSTPQSSSSANNAAQLQRQQQLLAMFAQNPMLAASLMNGGNQAQMMPLLAQLMNSQQHGGGGSGGGSSNNASTSSRGNGSSSNAGNNQAQSNLAMMALVHAAQQQILQNGGNNGGNNGAHMMQQLMLMQNQQQMMAALMSNPAMLATFARNLNNNKNNKK